jgi:hypothetical protein
MSLLDKMKETAKTAVSTGQEKLEERKLEKKIGELKEELGGLVYAQKTGSPAENADAEIARVIGEIKEAEEEIAKAEEKPAD